MTHFQGETTDLISGFLNEAEEHFLDEHGVIFMSSSPDSHVTGFDLREIMLKPFGVFYDQKRNSLEQATEDLTSVYHSGQINKLRWFKRHGGGVFLAKITLRKMKTHEFASHYCLRIYDYTPEYMAETRARQTQQRLCQMVNSPCSGTFQFRVRDGLILSAGNFVVSILPGGSLPGRVSDLFGSMSEWLELKKRVITNPGSTDTEFCIKGQATRFALLRCTATTTKGIMDGLILEVNSSKNDPNELESIYADMQALVYQTSHGFRAPLASALGLLGLIRMEGLVDQERKYLSLIEEQIIKMDRRVKNLATIAMIHQTPLANERIDLKAELNVLTDSLTREFPGVTITIGSLPQQDFVSDVFRLRIILQHVLRNACHFSKRIEGHWVAITVSLDSDKLYIEVYDNGIGISTESMGRLFEMFYRGSVASDGTGLGLYTVRRMIEKMNGSVDIDSVEGIGTTVRLRIPVKIRDSTPAQR